MEQAGAMAYRLREKGMSCEEIADVAKVDTDTVRPKAVVMSKKQCYTEYNLCSLLSMKQTVLSRNMHKKIKMAFA